MYKVQGLGYQMGHHVQDLPMDPFVDVRVGVLGRGFGSLGSLFSQPPTLNPSK